MALRSPAVSLALPVFNGGDYLDETIRSIQEQTFGDFELTVTDNASSDGTPDIVAERAAGDRRIRLVRNLVNIGAAANYNLGFTHATGTYFKWCAHDDRLSPNFLDACVRVLRSHADTALAFAPTLRIGPANEIMPPVGAETPAIEAEDAAERFWQALELSGTCFPIFGLFRRSAVERSTLHRPYYSSDRALLAEAAIIGKFRIAEDAIFYNREHPERSINIADKVQRSLWQTGRKSRGAAAEHFQLARHLFEIAGRHPDLVSASRLRARLLRRSLRPRELGRYCLEMTSLVSPAAAGAIKGLVVGNPVSQRV
ncbi:Glycosyltransferase involved in cell wall bisynthesis [Sphingomonas laterariae]|uniref:Glycosyltransferase involved in cell wall bisynthesis n=1 Tax=Edaphosphingomonas laterariae TaxID=861865 RepID=A0A239IKA3_9SPHN|nr:glycosyltransferase family 2 protein [Sphingomonas laterariae]SNS93842.1 Glycosyltransferase involved in cell wall bisynthesis [Sphingomonas laterariae]